MTKSLPVWNVYHYNINAKTFEAYNVYSHGGFLRDLIEMRKIRNIKVFEKELHRSVIRYFWAKCEYELLLAEWPLNEKNPNYNGSVRLRTANGSV